MPEETPSPPNESSTCPSPEELASYADLTLTGARRREVRQHLRTCQGCSRAVLAMQRALSPIRDRHQGGGGWRGPWESATGTLPEDVAPAWDEHLKHCNRCLARTQLLTVRKPVLALGGASLAFGAALATLVLLPQQRQAQRQANQEQVALRQERDQLREEKQAAALLKLKVALLEVELEKAKARPAPSAFPLPSPAPQRLQVAQAAPNETLKLPDLDYLKSPQATLRDGERPQKPRFSLLSPLVTRVRSQRPTLRWSACPEAVRYEVYLARLNGGEPLLQKTLDAPTTSWSLEADLPRGEALAWEVHAIGKDGAELGLVPQGRFEVHVAQGLPEPSATPEKLAEAGLWEEARAKLVKRKATPRTQALLDKRK